MKLQKISDIEQTLYFTEYDFLQLFSKSFPFTNLVAFMSYSGI